MMRFWAGFITGVLTIVTALLLWYFASYQQFNRGTGALFGFARREVEGALPGARVLDVSVTTFPESTAKVNYVYDHLYDVPVVYQRGNQIKKITLVYGKSRGGWIGQSVSQIVMLDDQAKIVRTLGQGTPK